MTKYITTTAIAIALSAGAASAQDSTEGDWSTQSDTAYETDTVVTDHFAVSDVNLDATLDREEFGLFVASKAAEGDSDFIALADGGDIDTAFMNHDTNADGVLDSTEVSAKTEGDTEVTIEEQPES